jgi:hypothetical protein
MEERFRIEREVADPKGGKISGGFDGAMHLKDNQEYKDYVFSKYIETKRIIGFNNDSEVDETGAIKKIRTSMTFYSKADYDEFESDPVILNFRNAGSKISGQQMIVNDKFETFEVEDKDMSKLTAAD